MALEFVGDAISLSGLTGSKLKCDVIGEYYPFWWNITSGGPGRGYEYHTAIVELDAATGEVYIKDTGETILGSGGHALNLKCTNPNTMNLRVILVEKDPACFGHLKNVIRRRWKGVDVAMAEGPLHLNSSNIHLLNKALDSAIGDIERIQVGNALFFFDPLRSVEFQTVEKVARRRLDAFYKTGTEFVIFIFTSDWFLGRDDFAGLPRTTDVGSWRPEEKDSVLEADALFGNATWRGQILNAAPLGQRETALIELYRNRLHKWFRYVLPLPFNPKGHQVFHVILCSNFATGVRVTRSFYSQKTGNPRYSPAHRPAFNLFAKQHPETLVGLTRAQRPLQWKILWRTVVGHEEGICDSLCSDFDDIEPDEAIKQQTLQWLEMSGYLVRFDIDNAWRAPVQQYKLDWAAIKGRLGVDPPVPLKPLSPNELS